MRKKLLLLAIMLTLVASTLFVFAACGDDDDDAPPADITIANVIGSGPWISIADPQLFAGTTATTIIYDKAGNTWPYVAQPMATHAPNLRNAQSLRITGRVVADVGQPVILVRLNFTDGNMIETMFRMSGTNATYEIDVADAVFTHGTLAGQAVNWANIVAVDVFPDPQNPSSVGEIIFTEFRFVSAAVRSQYEVTDMRLPPNRGGVATPTVAVAGEYWEPSEINWAIYAYDGLTLQNNDSDSLTVVQDLGGFAGHIWSGVRSRFTGEAMFGFGRVYLTIDGPIGTQFFVNAFGAEIWHTLSSASQEIYLDFLGPVRDWETDVFELRVMAQPYPVGGWTGTYTISGIRFANAPTVPSVYNNVLQFNVGTTGWVTESANITTGFNRGMPTISYTTTGGFASAEIQGNSRAFTGLNIDLTVPNGHQAEVRVGNQVISTVTGDGERQNLWFAFDAVNNPDAVTIHPTVGTGGTITVFRTMLTNAVALSGDGTISLAGLMNIQPNGRFGNVTYAGGRATIPVTNADNGWDWLGVFVLLESSTGYFSPDFDFVINGAEDATAIVVLNGEQGQGRIEFGFEYSVWFDPNLELGQVPPVDHRLTGADKSNAGMAYPNRRGSLREADEMAHGAFLLEIVFNWDWHGITGNTTTFYLADMTFHTAPAP